jgi:hypothetical protein
MTEPQFQRLAKSGGYSRRGLRGRIGVHRILESSSYTIGPHIRRRDPPRIPAAAGVGTKRKGAERAWSAHVTNTVEIGLAMERPMLQGQESILQRIGKVLRAQNDDITHEPVPTRWVDLIHYLDEQERRRRAPVNQKLSGAFRGRS